MIENPFEFGRAEDGDIVSFNDPFIKLWIRRKHYAALMELGPPFLQF